jgi:large subunit ribosomal protein L23
VLLYPLITEKTTLLRESQQQYQFIVHRKANKRMIVEAVKKIFNVEPISCKVINVLGKKKRMRNGVVTKPSIKKAIVRLKPNDKIPFFEGI